jgi:hypothetical protein
VASAIQTVHGELPHDHFTITIERSNSHTSPVPWGHVERGNPTNLLLVINPDLGHEALINDWTAFHEISHLLIPYRGWGDVWLSEGLATYYQNIIQARNGLFDENRMWDKIASGLDRGSRDQRWRQLNLTEVSDNLRETQQYMRVHWSGVLFWLSADIELRKQGKGTLDDTLKQLKDCCMGRSMTAEAIVRKLDDILDTELFVPLFKQYSKSHSIPDYQSILKELGIKRNRWTGGITLNNEALLADIRREIFIGGL